MSTLAFDPDALRDKYRAERDKRLRADGNDQYVEVDRRVRALRRRPVRRAASSASRCTDEVEVAGHRRRLRRPARRRPPARGRHRRHPHHREGRRLRRHLVLEPLPRRACATSSRTSTCRCSRRSATSRRRSTPTRPRSSSTARRIARALRPLRRRAASRPRSPSCAGTTTPRAGSSRTDRGDAHAGPLRRAWPAGRCTGRSCPASPASTTFEGHTFHTSRWDYDYTGGDSDGEPRPACADKRVGIIGTGATAVQCVPHLGEAAKQLYVFQRTPSSIDVRDNRPTDPEWAATPRAGLAAAADGELQHPRRPAAPSRRGPRQRRLDRHHRQAARSRMRDGDAAT